MRLGNILIFSIGLILASPLISTQEVINNPAAPAGKSQTEAIRVVKLIEVLRISDKTGDFSFKNPRRIKIAPDGSVFVAEREQLFKFDSQGRFEKTFLKKGEGPGEIKYFANFFFDSQEVVIGSFMPVKLIFSDLDGSFRREFRIHQAKPFTLLLHGSNDKFYFRSNDISPGNIKNGINRRTHLIDCADNQGKLTSTGLSFTTLDAVIKKTSEKGATYLNMDEITEFITAFDQNRYLYVSHQARYRITQVDPKSDKIILHFTRPFQPVDFQMKEDLEENDRKLEKIKNQKYYNDIYALRIHEGKLMVFTSAMDTQKRVLVDVFDHNGKYIDCFYLKIPGISRPDDLRRKPLYFDRDHFWTTSTDEDDNPLVIKYKMN